MIKGLPDTVREQLAWRIRSLPAFDLPDLEGWNSSPCAQHTVWLDTYFDGTAERQREVTGLPKPGCRRCGVRFRAHQEVGIAWLYTVKRGLLADSVGTGKTLHAAGLFAMMRQYGEMDRGARFLIVARSPALLQWQAELNRVLPTTSVEVAAGPKKRRQERYCAPWEIMLIGPQMLLNDYELLEQYDLAALVCDDVDALRNRRNQTSYVLKRIARRTPRCVVMTGTPLQKKLHEIHSVLEPVGGRGVFGSEQAFMKRYVRTEPVSVYNNRTGRRMIVKQVVGYHNLDEFKALVAPLYLRRTAADIEDVHLPEVVANNVSLELYPAQQRKYAELRKGVLEIIRKEGTEIKQATAMAQLHYGAQICAGLAALGEQDGPSTSVKLDWLMDTLEGDLDGEKVVVFAAYKNTVRAIQERLRVAGIGAVTIWGEQPDHQIRQRDQMRFWDDPNCRVLIGTQSIEQSLNLQVARHLVNVDMILNPSRMEQLAGRIRRDGSAFRHVYVHNLLTVGTQEERYLPLLEREQALINYVWDESSELFEQISPLALLELISG